MDAFKPIIAKVATGSPLRARKPSTPSNDPVRRIDPGPNRRFPDGAAGARRDRDEIAGAVAAMRAKMLRVDAPADAIDIVGTGGDNSGSYNVSTLAAISPRPVASGRKARQPGSVLALGRGRCAGRPGREGGTRTSGSRDCIEEAGVGFMFAPTHHASMRHVAPARIELGTRTIFNSSARSPTRPASSARCSGVFSESWLQPIADTLKVLGSERVWVVYGRDGLDEISTTTETAVVALETALSAASSSPPRRPESSARARRT